MQILWNMSKPGMTINHKVLLVQLLRSVIAPKDDKLIRNTLWYISHQCRFNGICQKPGNFTQGYHIWAYKKFRLAKNWYNSGLFHRWVSVYFGSLSRTVLKLIWKSPGFWPFWGQSGPPCFIWLMCYLKLGKLMFFYTSSRVHSDDRNEKLIVIW